MKLPERTASITGPAGGRTHLRAAGFRPLALACLASFVACASPVRQPGPAPAPAIQAELVLLGTTDTHAWLYPYDYYTGRETSNGLARLLPLVDSIRTAHPGRTLLFDSGDLLQGTPLASLYARENAPRPNPIIRAMNLVGYDAAAIGNHEFNFGIEHLDEALQDAAFPFISANIFVAGTDRHAYPALALLHRPMAEGDTLLIGVTATTPAAVQIWDRDSVDGVLEFRDPVRSLRPVVDSLRTLGADVVVVLSHGGLGASGSTGTTGVPPANAAAAIARQVRGVDVVFMGHDHREVADTTINGVLLLQGGNWARSLAEATLTLERDAPGDWHVSHAGGRLLRPDPARADTAFLDSLRWAHERTLVRVRSIIGQATEGMDAREARVRDTPILDFVNEVQRRAAGADLSSTAAFNLRAAIPAGPVTIADIAGLYVYDNTLKAVRITGAQLRAYLEQSARYYRRWDGSGGPVTAPDVPGYNFDVVSGVDYVIDLSMPAGQRIASLTYHGEPVRPDQTFTLALNNYRQGGSGGFDMLAGLPVVYDRQESIRDLLIADVQRRGTLRPRDDFVRNWRIEPPAAVAAALREQAPRDARAPAPAGTRLRVLSTNDFHGHLEVDTPGWAGGRPVGGSAAISALFRAERAGFGGPTLVVDAGDVMQGTPISGLTHGRTTVAIYNAMGYDAVAFGNHEYDWTVDTLRVRVAQATYPWLSANTFVADGDTLPAWVEPITVVQTGDVSVGIIGLTTEETPTETRPSNVRQLEFRSLSATIDHWVPLLRDRGVDFVVVLAHEGGECDAAGEYCTGKLLDAARRVTQRPDLIVGGHTHRVVNTIVNGIPIVEAGSNGTRYSVTDLWRGPDGVAHAWVRDVPTAWADLVPPDTAIAATVARFAREIEPLVARPVARLAEPLERGRGEYALGRLIADAQRWATGAQVAIMNNGGIRTALEAGTVTWGDLNQLQPFANTLVRLRLTGTQLRAALEHTVAGDHPIAQVSGIRIWYDPAREPGNRVVTAELDNGEPLRDDAVYAVTVNNFMAEGGDGFAVLTDAIVQNDTGMIDLDALVDYLRQLPQPVEAPADARLRAGAPARAPGGAAW